MEDGRFRWRTNPAIIAQYFGGDSLPKDIAVHLKPNEACVVIEDGTVVGVATSTRLTINPKLGTLSRLLAKREPFRSFLFVHLGPHEILVKLKGMWADGQEGKGIGGLRLSFQPENLARLLLFPSKGKMTITAGDIADSIEASGLSNFGLAQMSQIHSSSATSDSESITLLEAGLRSIASNSVVDLGAKLDRVWMSWAQSENERLLSMRSQLEVMTEEGRIIDAMDGEEMRRIVDAEIRRLEAEHRLFIAGEEYSAKRESSGDIARIRAKAEREAEQWQVLVQRSRRDEALTDEMKEVERRREKEDVIHDIELDELKTLRRSKQTEWVRGEEKKAASHNAGMMKEFIESTKSEEGDD